MSRSHKNVAQSPLHHVIYAPAKFAVATSNGLGGDVFTRNNSHTYYYVRMDRLWYEINITFFLKRSSRWYTIGVYTRFLPVTFILGSRLHKMLHNTLYITSPMNLQSLKLLRRLVKDWKRCINLQENTLYGIDLGVKVT